MDDTESAPRPNLDRYQAEVLRGCPSMQAHWREADRQRRYYERKNAALIRARDNEAPAAFDRRCKLTSKITSKVVNELAKGLYPCPPTRTLGGPAGDWYAAWSAAERLDSRLHTADRWAWLHGYYALQLAPGVRGAEKVVKAYGWRADEFGVFCRDDDPSEPDAVVVRSRFPGDRVRWQLWGSAEVRTYWGTAKAPDSLDCADGTIRPGKAEEHGLGVLPFAFFHNEEPVSDFCTPGVGRALADCNAVLDERLSDLDQAVQVFCCPRGYAVGVSAQVELHHVPGDLTDLVPSRPGVDPAILYPQPELNVEEVWRHILNYANQTLIELDLPLAVLPEQFSAAESGVAIAMRRVPLIELWRARQGTAKRAESSVCKVALAVAGAWLGRPELAAAAAAAAEALEVDFPEPQLPLPSPERNQADQWEREQGSKSLVMVVMERYGKTRQQAIEHLRRVAEDAAEEARIFGQPTGPEQPAPATSPAGTGSNPNDAGAIPGE